MVQVFLRAWRMPALIFKGTYKRYIFKGKLFPEYYRSLIVWEAEMLI